MDLSDGIKFQSVDLAADEVRFLTWLIAVALMSELPKFIALFVCLHIGRDYTDGIVRNKIIAGHSRLSIYGSYMITQIIASIALCVIYIPSALLGLAISGIGVDLNGGEMFGRFAVAIFVFLVMTVSFVVLASIFRRRAAPVILCIVIAMVSNTAAAVVGSFNTPSKAVDKYLSIRNEHFEELVDYGVVDRNTADHYEEEYGRSYFLKIGWKIIHPAYVLSPMGFEGDYQAGGMTNLVMGGSAEYTDEINFAEQFYYNDPSVYMILSSADGYNNAGNFDANDLMLTVRDFRKADELHLKFSELNWIYVGKSAIWMTVIAVYGYIVFRKKNMF